MTHFVIVSGSVRVGRNSPRVATYFQKYIETNQLGTVEVLDLMTYNFPIFDERLRLQKNPTSDTLKFAEKIKAADAIILVTPEYNGGYPAAVKNVIDLLYDEWFRKPIAVATVSAGDFAGTQAITSLQFTLWKMKAWTVPATFPVPKVQDAFDENGVPKDAATTDKRAKSFLDELIWAATAKAKMSGQ